MESETQDSPKDPQRKRMKPAWDSLWIGGLFLGIIVALYLVRLWAPIDEHVIAPFTRFIATLSRILLGITGAEVAQDGTRVTFGGITLNILEECNGVPALIVFVAAILAYPSNLARKGIGLLIGLPAIFVVNEIRVLSLFLVYKYATPQLFHLIHVYVWQIAIILVAILLWIYWAERFVRKPGAKGTAA